jgi:hypothetical protein
MSSTVTPSQATSGLSSPVSPASPESQSSTVLSMQTPSHTVVTSSSAANTFLNERSPRQTVATGDRPYVRNLTEARFVSRVELVAVLVLLLFVVLGLLTLMTDPR